MRFTLLACLLILASCGKDIPSNTNAAGPKVCTMSASPGLAVSAIVPVGLDETSLSFVVRETSSGWTETHATPSVSWNSGARTLSFPAAYDYEGNFTVEVFQSGTSIASQSNIVVPMDAEDCHVVTQPVSFSL